MRNALPCPLDRDAFRRPCFLGREKKISINNIYLTGKLSTFSRNASILESFGDLIYANPFSVFPPAFEGNHPIYFGKNGIIFS